LANVLKEMGDVGRFVLDHLGPIPKAGASFMHGSARFEVVDMDGNGTDKVLIEVGQKSDEEAPEALVHD
jgi:CBS domain containing-hemolysin-like protein